MARNPYNERCTAARRRAAERGLVFELNPEYLRALYTGHCALCEVQLTLRGPMTSTTGVIDRIYPPAGYARANVRWLCNQCNVMKG